MKKLGLLVAPIIAISFLVSCNGGGNNPPSAKDYLCFTCNSDNGELHYGIYDKLSSLFNEPDPPIPEINIDLEYSKDLKTWSKPDEMVLDEIGYHAKICNLEKDEKVYLRGDNPNGWHLHIEEEFEFQISFQFMTPLGDFSVSGNIMSIIDKNNFESLDTIPTDECFSYLFFKCNISDASKLILPATNLTESCYEHMFQASSIINAPQLPATTLTKNCYGYMFAKCKHLINAPALPANTLASNCYECMFWDCDSLINAPALPATALASYCYSEMFWECDALTQAPKLPAIQLSDCCYNRMFTNCSALTQIEVGFGEEGDTMWPDAQQCTDSWFSGIRVNVGTFIWKGSTDQTELESAGLFNESHIHTGWTVQNPESRF